MAVGPASLAPFANLAYVNLDTDGFAETGGAAALTAAGQTWDTTFSTLGLRAEMPVAVGGTDGRIRAVAGWRHAFDDTPEATLAFASGGAGFTVAGAPLARDALVLDAGLEMDVAPNVRLGLSGGGQLGSGVADGNLKADFTVRF
jgi:outer membrane autotransporter protein